MTRRGTIIFVGISGVGKTTFLRAVPNYLQFQHLSAGALIAQTRLSQGWRHDDLRLADVSENQKLLLTGFEKARDAQATLVVLDGHIVVHGEKGLQTLDHSIFKSLGASAFVHMVAAPAVIADNRRNDTRRTRPILSLEEIADHQTRSMNAARHAASELAIPMQLISHGDMDEFCAFAASVG